MSTTMNPCKPGTFPRNTIQNPQSDGHCMPVTTRGGKQTIDPPMSSVVEEDIRKEYEAIESSGELGDAPPKEAKLS